MGAQVGTWSYYIQYIQDYTHQPEKVAGYFLTGTLVAFGIGRFTATYLMKFIAPTQLMGIYGIINTALVGMGVLFPGWLGVGAVFMTSFFMSLMFPTIFALGIKELGPNTKLGGSIIIMSIIGGACAPPAMGLIFQVTHSMARCHARAHGRAICSLRTTLFMDRACESRRLQASCSRKDRRGSVRHGTRPGRFPHLLMRLRMGSGCFMPSPRPREGLGTQRFSVNLARYKSVKNRFM